MEQNKIVKAEKVANKIRQKQFTTSQINKRKNNNRVL